MNVDDLKKLMFTAPPPEAHFPVTPGVKITSEVLKAEIIRFMQANPHAVVSFTGGDTLEELEANYPRIFRTASWKRDSKSKVSGKDGVTLNERCFVCEEGPDAYCATTRDDGTRILSIVIDQF